jgi:hypothetical protein
MENRIIYIIGLLLVLFSSILPYEKALADTPVQPTQSLLNPVSGEYLDQQMWCINQNSSWAYATANCDTGGGTTPFDKTNDSYIMLQDNLAPTTGSDGHVFNYNRYHMYMVHGGKKITITKSPTMNTYYITWPTNVAIYRVNIIAEPNNDPRFQYNWTGAYAIDQYQVQVSNPVQMSDTTNAMGIPFSNSDSIGEVGAINITYSSSFDLKHFGTTVPYAADTTGTQCATLDVGCYIGKFISRLSSDFQDLIIAIGQAFVTLFVPDSATIKSNFDNLRTFLTNKLGFITYPFTFFINFFNSFTQSGQACSTADCTIHFGTFMGKPYQINLTQASTSLPGLWTLFTTLSRGLLVLGLMYSIRREFHSTVAK